MYFNQNSYQKVNYSQDQYPKIDLKYLKNQVNNVTNYENYRNLPNLTNSVNEINSINPTSLAANQIDNQIQPKPRLSKTKVLNSNQNPVFKFLSYVNEINGDKCVAYNHLIKNDKNNKNSSNENNLNSQNVISDKYPLNTIQNYNSPLISSNLPVKINCMDKKVSKLNLNSQDDTSKLTALKYQQLKSLDKSIDDSFDCKLLDKGGHIKLFSFFNLKKVFKLKTNSNSTLFLFAKDFQLAKMDQRKSLPDLRTAKILDYTKDKQICSKESLNSKLKDQIDKSQEPKSGAQNQNMKIKTSWLMRKGQNDREWFRHWFVLKDTLLAYYRDQSAESNSLLDGLFDLALVRSVQSKKFLIVNQNSNLIYYPFLITMYDGKQYEIAALTNEERDEWIKLIENSQTEISYRVTDFQLKKSRNSRKIENIKDEKDKKVQAIDQQVGKMLTYDNKEQLEKKDSGKKGLLS